MYKVNRTITKPQNPRFPSKEKQYSWLISFRAYISVRCSLSQFYRKKWINWNTDVVTNIGVLIEQFWWTNMNVYNFTPFLWRYGSTGSFWVLFDPLGISVTVKFRNNYSSELSHNKLSSPTFEFHIHGILQYVLQWVSRSHIMCHLVWHYSLFKSSLFLFIDCENH